MRHKIKGIFGYGLLIVVFGAIAFFILANYNVLTAEKTTVKVMMKQSEKGLYSAPQYYIYTLSEDTGVSKSSVNQNQLLHAEDYDNITGYQMGTSFYTKNGLIKSGILAGLFLFVSIAFILIGVLGLITVFTKRSRFRIIENLGKRLFKVKYIFAILAIAVIFFAGKFAVTVYQETVADEHADAVITNKDADFSGGGYRSIGHTTYTFSLKFDDRNGNKTEVIQTVYKKTYDQHEEDESIPITYQSGNPYNIFLPEQSIFDWFYFTPNMIYIYLLLGIVIFIVGSVVKDHIKGERTQETRKDTGSSDEADLEDAELDKWIQAYDFIKDYEENPSKSDVSATEIERAYNIVEDRKKVKDEINMAYLWETFWKCGIWSSIFIIFFILIEEFTFIWVIVLFTILFPFSKLVFDRLIGFRMRRKINLSPKWRYSDVVDNFYIFINVCLFFLSIFLAPIGIFYLLIRVIVRKLRK